MESAVGGAIAMGTIPDIREIPAAARGRILLICPDCGQENVAFADKLRGTTSYDCTGEGCSYRFDLVSVRRKSVVQAFTEAWRRVYATLNPAR
jgi:hypothetical protein